MKIRSLNETEKTGLILALNEFLVGRKEGLQSYWVAHELLSMIPQLMWIEDKND